MSGLELKIASYIPAIIGVCIVGLLVFLNNPSNVKNRIFALLNLSIAIWLGFLFIADTTTNVTTALWSLKLGLFIGQAMFLLFFLFALEFPFRTKLRLSHLILYSLPIVLLMAAMLTPLGVKAVSIQNFGVQPEQFGALYAASDVTGLLYLIAGGGLLLSKRHRATAAQRSQISFVLTGLAIVIAANVFTGVIVTLFRVDSNFVWIGSFSLFIFSALVAYAIIKHKFFDVRPIVARSFAYVLLLVTLSIIFGAVVLGATALFFRGENTHDLVANAVYLSAALLMAFSFQPLRKFFDRVSNRIFYRDAYDPQIFLNQLNNALVSNFDADSLVTKSTQIIEANIKPSFVSFYLSGTPHVPRRFISSQSQPGLSGIVEKVKPLIDPHKQKVLITDDLQERQDTHHLYEVLRKNNIGTMISLVSQDHKTDEIGFVFIGYKKSGNPYDAQDCRVLEIVANELVIAIQNALRFQEIENFNATLQERIAEATRKLRSTNEKLRTLDETKDDFISMASHQLRTPLTSVKGYVSMVLDGDAGKITPLQRKLLGQSFVSAQRMVYLISDLLNLSRLRTGKFVIESTPCNLADVIKSEIEQLVETAKGRSLELTYHKPDNFPTYMLDETKLRQVIMNFVDNAIYYTPSGGKIEVVLQEKPNSIEFTVTDNGIGVPKHEQHHLFTKFFRAHNAKRARPDGTGLGLFMAKKVVIAQGGAIIFKSQEGKGSTFGFSFAKDRLNSPPAKTNS